MSEERRCLWPGCEIAAPCCCDEHWKLLPENIRNDLGRCFDMFGESRGHRNAIARAQAWIRTEFAARQDRGYDPGKWERLKRLVRDRDDRRRRRAAVPVDQVVGLDVAVDAPSPRKPWRHLRVVTDEDERK